MLCFGQQKCDQQSEQQSMERSPTKKTHIKHKVNKMHIKQNTMEHLSNTMQWKKTFWSNELMTMELLNIIHNALEQKHEIKNNNNGANKWRWWNC
jgi:hypothetical protein